MLNRFGLWLESWLTRFHDWGHGRTPEPELPIPEVRTVSSLYAANKFAALPETSEQTNGGVKCDMAVGPCACGAWHSDGVHPGHTGPVRKDIKKPRKKPNARKSNKSRSNS